MSKENRSGPIVLIHPRGNANVRQALRTFREAGRLGAFCTSVATDPAQTLQKLLPGGVRAEWMRRSFPEVGAGKIWAHPGMELMRLAAQRTGCERLTRAETGRFCHDNVAGDLDRWAARRLKRLPELGAVYAYDDCAVESFRAAREMGAACLYELPIAYLRLWSVMSREEQALQPEWYRGSPLVWNSEEKLERKDREIAAADAVFVPSHFVARSLDHARVKPAKVWITPYGCPTPEPVLAEAIEAPEDKGRRLRVLFVGGDTLRKGIGYLLGAMRRVEGMAELTVISNLGPEMEGIRTELLRHNWIKSLPHSAVQKLMQQHDVLVLPTLFEGRALVVLEALAAGLPVITTPNSGCEDVVRDGVSGYLIPIRSSEAIAEALTRLHEDRALLAAMRQGARDAAAGCPWGGYRQALLAAVNEVTAR